MSKTITLTVQHENGSSELLSQSTIVCPPATDDPPSRYVVKTDDLRIRSLPSLQGTIVGYLQAGQEIDAIGEDMDADFYWVQLSHGRWAARGNPSIPFQHLVPIDDEEPEEVYIAAVTLFPMIVRDVPNGREVGRLLLAEDFFTWGAFDDPNAYRDVSGYRWRQLALGSAHSLPPGDNLVGYWVAEAPLLAPGQPIYSQRYIEFMGVDYSAFDGSDPPPKSELTGDIQPVKVISPSGVPANRFQNGNQPWSFDPKLLLMQRSAAVMRERIRQFYYQPDDFYFNMPEAEYQAMLDTANNATQSNPRPINVGYFGYYSNQKEFFDSVEKRNRLIDLNVRFLDDLASRHMQAFVVGNDSLHHWHNYPAEDKYHTLPGGRLNAQYYLDEAYEAQMIPFIRELARETANHPGFGFFQVSNEDNIEGQPEVVADAYYKYVRRVRDVFREYNTTAPFGLRIENTNKLRWINAKGNRVTNDEVLAKFADLVDFWQAHMYADPNAASIYSKWLDQDRVYDDLFRLAMNHGLPPILDETMIQHINASIDVTHGSTEQAEHRWVEMLGLGLYILGIWGYHQGDLDRALADASSFTNILAAANKIGYKGFYDMKAMLANLAHVVIPRDFRWQLVA